VEEAGADSGQPKPVASGIAGLLQDALRHATTELARWLEHDCKLSANESNIILGSLIRYDIGEVVDPQVHIVAKVSKALLATLQLHNHLDRHPSRKAIIGSTRDARSDRVLASLSGRWASEASNRKEASTIGCIIA
jgi:hypothetical protein